MAQLVVFWAWAQVAMDISNAAIPMRTKFVPCLSCMKASYCPHSSCVLRGRADDDAEVRLRGEPYGSGKLMSTRKPNFVPAALTTIPRAERRPPTPYKFRAK